MILEVFSWCPFTPWLPGKKRCLTKMQALGRQFRPTPSEFWSFSNGSGIFYKLPQVICGQTVNQELLWWKVWNKNNKCLYFLYISYILGTIVSAFRKSTRSSPVPSVMEVLSPPLFRRGNWGTERFNRVPMIIYLFGDRDKSWSQAIWPQRSFSTIIS